MGTAKSCRRYALLDAIRGLAVLNMVLFHFFSLTGLFFPEWIRHGTRSRRLSSGSRGICQTFIFVSGMTWALGHRHFRHGLILNLLGAGITAVTFFPPARADGLVRHPYVSRMRLPVMDPP